MPALDPTPSERPVAAITGGGTSGHVLPALAIAESLVDRGHDVRDVVYIGCERGIETRLVPPSGHPAAFLDVVGLQRRLTRSALVTDLWFGPKLARATAQARSLLRAHRPRVVVSVGGYASLPATLAARTLRIPLVVVSYDRRPGRSSQLAARMATASAVAYPGMEVLLPRAEVTGAPVRRAVRQVDRDRDRSAARRRLDLPEDRTVVAVVGGSLGSGPLNRAIGALVDRWSDRSDVAVRHVVGERFRSEAMPQRDGRDGILYQVIGYEPDMPAVYAAADLVVARAGASTVAELALVGAPSVLVPWAGAADDHQQANAEWLVAAGGARLVRDEELGRLGEVVAELVDDPAARSSLADGAHRAGAVHRGDRLAELIERVAREGAPR